MCACDWVVDGGLFSGSSTTTLSARVALALVLWPSESFAGLLAESPLEQPYKQQPVLTSFQLLEQCLGPSRGSGFAASSPLRLGGLRRGLRRTVWFVGFAAGVRPWTR